MDYRRRWLVVPLGQRRMLCALAVAVVAANLWQPYPEIAPLQHVPTLALLLASPWLLRRWPLSDASVAALVAFFLLHTLAGRYTYSNVPYDAWGRALTGRSINAAMGWSRNNFDRLVHLCFGLLWVPPVAEVARRYCGNGLRLSLWIAFLFVGCVSAFYEIFEWLLTIVLAPGMADDYNGQQGDVWDAQKDMAIAVLGSIISLTIGACVDIDLLIDLSNDDLAKFGASAIARGTTTEELISKELIEGVGDAYLPTDHADESVMHPLVHLNLIK